MKNPHKLPKGGCVLLNRSERGVRSGTALGIGHGRAPEIFELLKSSNCYAFSGVHSVDDIYRSLQKDHHLPYGFLIVPRLPYHLDTLFSSIVYLREPITGLLDYIQSFLSETLHNPLGPDQPLLTTDLHLENAETIRLVMECYSLDLSVDGGGYVLK